MQFNIISYNLFLFLMVVFFPFLIYAPWTEASPPTQPSNNYIRMTCAEWIHFNGFALDNYLLNRERARARDPKMDKKASIWAAAYALKIGGTQELYQILPQEFCESFGARNRVPKRFIPIEDEHESCKGWIQLYGFSENNVSDNKSYALNTPKSQARHISIYAYDYWLFLRQRRLSTNLDPSEFCSKIGVNLEQHRFVCPYGSSLTCLEWMMLYEFDLNPYFHLQKADSLAKDMGTYPLRIHFFPDRYCYEILAIQEFEEAINEFTASNFCLEYHGSRPAPLRYPFDFTHPLV